MMIFQNYPEIHFKTKMDRMHLREMVLFLFLIFVPIIDTVLGSACLVIQSFTNIKNVLVSYSLAGQRQ